jgi:hypothetical protein
MEERLTGQKQMAREIRIKGLSLYIEDEVMAGQPRGRGRPKSSANKTDQLNLLPQPSTTAWQKAAFDELGVARSSFYELKKTIEASKAAVHSKTEGWKIPQVIFRTD